MHQGLLGFTAKHEEGHWKIIFAEFHGENLLHIIANKNCILTVCAGIILI